MDLIKQLVTDIRDCRQGPPPAPSTFDGLTIPATITKAVNRHDLLSGEPVSNQLQHLGMVCQSSYAVGWLIVAKAC
jgi:hypothetical protein